MHDINGKDHRRDEEDKKWESKRKIEVKIQKTETYIRTSKMHKWLNTYTILINKLLTILKLT